MYIAILFGIPLVLAILDAFTSFKLSKGLRFVVGEFSLLLIIILALAVPEAGRSASFWWILVAEFIITSFFFAKATFGPDD